VAQLFSLGGFTLVKIMKRWQLQLLLALVLYGGVAIYAYVNAMRKHTGVEFPSGRGIAVCAFLGFSALCAYNVFAGLKSGVVGLGGRGGSGAFYMRRDENLAGFVFFLLIYIALSLFFFYMGVSSMFET